MEERDDFELEDILNQYSSNRTKEEDPYESESDFFSGKLPAYLKRNKKNITELPLVTRHEICDWVESLIISVVSVVFVMVFIARVNQVYGVSMQPTLTEGDRLIVTPLYGEPRHGDIIVIKAENLPNSKTGEMGEPIVKRVIGLPGDEINIDKDSGEVFRNGERLEELYIAEKILPEKTGNQIYPLIIEENCVFVMGDNRNHSTDSRVTKDKNVVFYVGIIDMGNIIGKARFRIFPFNVFGGLD